MNPKSELAASPPRKRRGEAVTKQYVKPLKMREPTSILIRTAVIVWTSFCVTACSFSTPKDIDGNRAEDAARRFVEFARAGNITAAALCWREGDTANIEANRNESFSQYCEYFRCDSYTLKYEGMDKGFSWVRFIGTEKGKTKARILYLGPLEESKDGRWKLVETRWFSGSDTRAVDPSKTPESASPILTSERVLEASLLFHFDERKWRVAERNEKRGAVLRRLSLYNESEEKRISLLTPRVGERENSLSQLADFFAVQIDEPRPPKRTQIAFLSSDAIFMSGTAFNRDRTIKRSRAIVVFFRDNEEWCIIYSCRGEVEPRVEDILLLVRPLY